MNRKRIMHATSGATFSLLAASLIVTGCGAKGVNGPTVQPPSAQQPPFSRAADNTVVAPRPSTAVQPPNRTTPPALASVPRLSLPPIHSLTLSNGMRVLVVEKRDLPLVQVNFVVNAGSVNDPADRASLASITADMLDEGAGGRKALDLATAFEMLGARFSIGASTHSSSASLHAPVARLDDALRLVGDVFMRPDLPAAELERLRKERMTALVRAHDNPGTVAGALSTQTLFGVSHPYGRMPTAAALNAITVADVRRFYGSYWVPGNMTAIVVGDVTTDRARQALETAFGTWKAGSSDVVTPAIAAAPQVQGRRIYIVDKPGAAQSVMLLGRIGVPRSTADYFPLQVMNTILGGSFTSRLNQNLREKNGYAYGASSGFDYRLAAGPWTAQSNVQTQSTGPALKEFMTELRRIREDITAEEVERAKNNLAMSYAPGFQSVAGIAGRLADMVTYSLPADYFNQYTARVLAVTKADVDRVAKQYIDPDNMAVFIVGDRATIEAQVRQQNLGDIRFLSIDDVLGPVPAVK